MQASESRSDYLRRLPKEYYQGHSFVHWSMSMDQRKKGWLDRVSHLKIREVILHAMARYRLACPVYCLMPDHMHLFWIGLSASSDQRLAASFFRKYAGEVLRCSCCGFQKQAYDNVLREKDREKDAVMRLAYYISSNPVRAGLVADARDWEFSGSMMLACPDLDWREKDFSERFWKIYGVEVQGSS